MCSHSRCRRAHRSQRMEVRHPPQRKLRVSAFSEQPNHKSCQATLVSAGARAHTHIHTRMRCTGRHAQCLFTRLPLFLCRCKYKREGFGDYKGASLPPCLFCRCIYQYLLFADSELLLLRWWWWWWVSHQHLHGSPLSSIHRELVFTSSVCTFFTTG